MTTMDLFIHEPELTFERAKRASIQLDENPENWDRQILVELYTSVPQISEYSPQVTFMRIDKEQGFGFGVVVVSNDTDSALSAVRPSSNAPKAYIPIVVRGHQLCPLDLLMTRGGKLMPLSEHRLREALFRPETFDTVTDDWGDTSLYHMFYPPGRHDTGFGSGQAGGDAMSVIHGPGMKMAEFSLLGEIGGTMLAPDFTRLIRSIETEPGLMKAAETNQVFLAGLQRLGEFQKTACADASDLMKTALEVIEPDVLQMGWSPVENEYWIKSASRSHFYDRPPRFLSRGEMLKHAGPEITKKVDVEGTVTMAGTGGALDPNDSSWAVITEPGIYKVKTVEGKELIGWVLPRLLDLGGNLSPVSVFHNGTAAAVQDQIVGTRLATGADLPSVPPKGTGLFYVGGSSVVATLPLKVVGAKGAMSGEKIYLVQMLTGEDASVRIVPGLKALVARGGEYFAPETTMFMPLDDEEPLSLVDRVDVVKAASGQSVARLWGDGSEFNIRFMNAPKLASIVSPVLGREEAAFVLCLAGLDASQAINKVAAASSGYGIDVPVVDIGLAYDLVEESSKIAEERSRATMSLRRQLIKEAAVLPNVMTVDSVLSLGFINSENVRLFIARLPYLEKSLHQICELLLAARMGLNEIPESATGRAGRGLDDVIQGLRALMLRKVEEGD